MTLWEDFLSHTVLVMLIPVMPIQEVCALMCVYEGSIGGVVTRTGKEKLQQNNKNNVKSSDPSVFFCVSIVNIRKGG